MGLIEQVYGKVFNKFYISEFNRVLPVLKNSALHHLIHCIFSSTHLFRLKINISILIKVLKMLNFLAFLTPFNTWNLKILATCYSKVLLLTPHSSKLLLFFIIFFLSFSLPCSSLPFSFTFSLPLHFPFSLHLELVGLCCGRVWLGCDAGWLGYGGFSWIVGLCGALWIMGLFSGSWIMG